MQERKQINKMDMKVIMDNLRRLDKYSEEQLQLVQDDLLFGLSKEETDRYTQKNYDLRQMRVYSKCLRNGFDDEVIEVLASDKLTGLQMEVALEFFEKGIPVEIISKVAGGDINAASMKRTYQRVVSDVNKASNATMAESEYVKQLLEEIKEVVGRIDYQDKRYDALNEKLKELEIVKKEQEEDPKSQVEMKEKDQLLNEQQNKLNEAHGVIARLRNEIDAIRKEKENMQNKINDIQSNQIQKEDELKYSNSLKEFNPNSKNNKENVIARFSQQTPVYFGIPVEYGAFMMGSNENGGNVVTFEKTEKKSAGIVGFASRILFKKKSKQSLVKLIASNELDKEQIVQIRVAMESGLTEEQLFELIQSKISAEQMKEIIEIAVLENSMGN